MDPRRWDLHQLLAAYESTLRQNCKDEAEWTRLRSALYAEPTEVRKERVRAGRAAPAAARVGLSADAVASLLGSAAAQDAMYGTA